MVNTELLDLKINNSGLKVGFIVEKLGMSRQAFNKKKNNLNSFRVPEIYVLCDLLKITDDKEKNEIFFANKVEL